MEIIKTAPALSRAIASTYLYDAFVALVLIGLMVLIVKLIPWEGHNDNSGRKRRTVFFILMAVSLFASLLFDFLAFHVKISVPAFASKYMMHMALASILSAAVYFIIGFIIIKMAPIGSKLESIFPKKDK